MQQDTPLVCPHYNAYTLWWTSLEKETLTCPPDFTHNCLKHCMDVEDESFGSYYEMHESEIYDEEEEALYEDLFDQIREGIEHFLDMIDEEEMLNSVTEAA